MQIVIDGLLISYTKLGTSPGVLLILHGWGRSGQEWMSIAAAFQEQYTVIVLDLPGFGGSLRPRQTWGVEDYAVFVRHFLAKISVSTCTLLGHSFGGRVGIVMAATSTSITHLILVDSGGIEEKGPLLRIQSAAQHGIKPLLPEKILSWLRKHLGSADYQSSQGLQDILVAVVNQDLQSFFPKISIPTVVIWGERDAVLPVRYTKLFKRGIPQALVRIVWEAGHDPHLERPREFMEILKETI